MRPGIQAALALALAACASGAFAGGGTADGAARSLLVKALRGPDRPFAGIQQTEVVLPSGKAVTTVTVHGDGRGRIRREYRGGDVAGVVSLQVGRAVWQRVGASPWARLPGSAEADPAAAAADIVRNYNVSLGAARSLLGRQAVPLHIAARHRFDPSRSLVVDPATGIILSDELLAPDGRRRSLTRYTSLRLGPQPASLFAPPAGAPASDLFGPASFSPRSSAPAVQRETGRPVLLPAHVPAGYRVVLYGVMQTGSGRLMPAVRYSDGLAAFTIFQRGMMAGMGMGRGPGMGMGMGRRGMGGPPPGRGPRRGMGGPPGAAAGPPMCMAQSDVQQTVIAVTAPRSNYLVVGDLAEDELMRTARSLP